MKLAIPLDLLQRYVNETWRELWSTRIGYQIELHHVKPSGQIVGMLFEEILKHKLNSQDPNTWPLERRKGDKDLHYAPDTRLSIEIKTSGQKDMMSLVIDHLHFRMGKTTNHLIILLSTIQECNYVVCDSVI